MKSTIYLIFILCFILACANTPEPNKFFDSLKISKSTFNGDPLIGDISKMGLLSANNFQTNESCVKYGIPYKQGRWELDCLLPSENNAVKYAHYNDHVFLYQIDFRKHDLEIKTPNIDLNKNTTIAKLEKIFPKSFDNLNAGANVAKLNGEDWMYLEDDLPICSNGNNLEDVFWLPFKKSAEYLGMHYLADLHTFQDKLDVDEIFEFKNIIENKR